jgi:hypothetical protein
MALLQTSGREQKAQRENEIALLAFPSPGAKHGGEGSGGHFRIAQAF